MEQNEKSNPNPIQPEAVPEEQIPAEQAGEPAAPPPEEETPKTELELLQERYDEVSDRLLRTLAEFDNFRKRSQREKEELYPNATAAAVEKFLTVLDNFERAMACSCADSEFKKGMDMIHQSFKDVLAGFGVEEVGAVGEPFDPAFHNAVMHIEDPDQGENVITQVLQKGYRLGGRVLRYAMVQTAN